MVGEAHIAQAAIMTTVPNVAIVPSTLDLLGVELCCSASPTAPSGCARL